MNKGYWIICLESYEIDGTLIPKGRMSYHTSTRPIINKRWRRATDNEVKTMKTFKGFSFNLNP